MIYLYLSSETLAYLPRVHNEGIAYLVDASGLMDVTADRQQRLLFHYELPDALAADMQT
jgi:hypothetical protein